MSLCPYLSLGRPVLKHNLCSYQLMTISGKYCSVFTVKSTKSCSLYILPIFLGNFTLFITFMFWIVNANLSCCIKLIHVYMTMNQHQLKVWDEIVATQASTCLTIPHLLQILRGLTMTLSQPICWCRFSF